MYHLAKSVYQQLTRKEEYSVLILGLDNAGKTTFLERLKGEFGGKSLPAERIAPTIGQNVGHVVVDGMHLKLWDVGGQENLRQLWNSYYTECNAIVFVVDSTDRARLEECKNTLKEVVVNEATEGVPLLMLANKQDCEDSMDVVDIIEIFNKIAEHVSARDSRVLPISAKEGTGVKDAAKWLAVRLGRVPV